MLNYNLYIRNIIESIEKIKKTCKSKASLKDVDILDMTLTRLQTIGENSVKLPREIKSKHKNIKWRNLRKLRNVISHRYEIIDKDLIWNFIEVKIPELEKTMLEIKEELK